MPHPTLIDVASRSMADKPKKKKWIKAATSNSHGQFRKKAEAAGETTREFAKEHEHDSGKTGAQARLAENLMGLSHSGKKKKSKMYGHPTSRGMG
jgi:hypothetical protein